MLNLFIRLLYFDACERARSIGGSFFMKKYKIKSPTGKTFEVLADSIYHACSIVTGWESFKFNNVEYLKLNK